MLLQMKQVKDLFSCYLNALNLLVLDVLHHRCEEDSH